ncbi:Aspartate--tRNA ligase, cytoplasmic [Tetrabaena socialis]|uniref:aspartate--tRNA ligase n=1 Tax=Tetrabaena socialis TaxID=47790 RepID=A0A2J8A181_9CHLO|nr:Aspartate--tRNA ligase, cytoplasmic [Tetrabaena socialis]|eukprot:PNH06255.1 Aspartate--tRNA ligase, cytoplasmic [Tetrabaena socialis]
MSEAEVAALSVEDSQPSLDPDAKNPNAKKAAKEAAKAAKEAAKAERTQQRGVKAAVMTQPDADDPLREQYGDYPLVQSQGQSGRVWTRVDALNSELNGQKVLIRGRIHTTRGKGKSAFLVLRQRTATVQALLFADEQVVSKGMVKYATQVTKESIVDVEGIIKVPEKPVEGCSQKDVELHVTLIRVVSRAAILPFELVDAGRSEEEVKAAAERGEVLSTVGQDLRLDNRFLDLRTPANQAIFRLQSAVGQIFKSTLLGEGFQEIHTPKLIAGASEGGAAVFRLDYMGTPACLAQSPQLYKQMAICADFDRVFEIGPVFRAEFSYTHRHLCEFMGLDLEMAINEHYFEVLDVVEKLFGAIFDGLATTYAKELAVVGQQYPFEVPTFKPLRLTFPEGIAMLQQGGFPDVDPMGDLNTELERALGRMVKEKYGTDFFILHRYPSVVRPFYTMPCSDDANYSNSYDVFIRGEEIISGAQRVHDADLLVERANACGIPLDTIQSYIDSFKYGAPPHGGAGVGLERVVMLYCGLNNIRKTSMFPRDPKRLTP